MVPNRVPSSLLRKVSRVKLTELSRKHLNYCAAGQTPCQKALSKCGIVYRAQTSAISYAKSLTMGPPPVLQKQYMSSGTKPKKAIGEPRPSAR